MMILSAPSISAGLVSSEQTPASFATTFLFIAILLLAARLSGLVERFGQPAVVGELIIGIILGNLVLFGFHFFDSLKQDIIILFLAELGVVILLFQIGLESSIEDMKKVGWQAFLVAVVGVIVPFLLGTFVVGPWLLPQVSFNGYLFLGATLTATSVGITARLFKDLRVLKMREAQIVLGAAVIDDILGLIILAVVSGIATSGRISFLSIIWIFLKAVLFFIGAIIIGELTAPLLGKWLSKINAAIGMKFTLGISFALLFAFLAQAIGLAAIVGAFAAGLVLKPVHLRHFKDSVMIEELKQHAQKLDPYPKQHIKQIIEKHADHHIKELIEPLAMLMVPLFFVITGFMVDMTTLLDFETLIIAICITLVAVAGKVIAGYVVPKSNSLVIGFGMVPRGEVGLIFATIGKGLGVVSDQIFSVIIVTIILTTIIGPIALQYLLKTHRVAEINHNNT